MYRIGICDNSFFFRKGIIDCLKARKEFQLSIEASFVNELLKYLKEDNKLEILILGLRMGTILDLSIIKEIKNSFPEIYIIALANNLSPNLTDSTAKAGADELLSEACTSDDLVNAIEKFIRGEVDLNTDYLKKHEKNKMTDLFSIFEKLTKRELELAKHIASNKPYKEIAHIMKISVNTLENIRVRVFRKTGLRSRTEIALFVVKMGIINLEY